MRNKFGIHIGNTRNRNLNLMWDLGFHCYNALHFNVDVARQARERYSNSLIHCRFYLPKWSEKDPVEWARECSEIYANGWAEITKHVCPANEMNLEHEGGGSTEDWYRRINDWLLEWRAEFIKSFPDAVIHFPAFAYGNNEDVYGYRLCSDSLRVYDVINYHPYWFTLNGLYGTERGFRAFRFVSDRERFFPNKYVFISEFGNFNIQRVTTGPEFIYFYSKLYEYPWVLGGTAFIWDSGPEHGQNVWQNNLSILSLLKDWEKVEVEFPFDSELLYPRLKYRAKVRGWVDFRYEVPDKVPAGTLDGFPLRPLSQVDTVVVHHSGTDYSNFERHLKAIHRYHIGNRGWPGIAYHYAIKKDGTIYWLGPASTIRYHAGHWETNQRSVAVLIPGNNPSPTLEQIESLLGLISRLIDITGNDISVIPHSKVRQTYCPGDNLRRLITELWPDR